MKYGFQCDIICLCSLFSFRCGYILQDQADPEGDFRYFHSSYNSFHILKDNYLVNHRSQIPLLRDHLMTEAKIQEEVWKARPKSSLKVVRVTNVTAFVTHLPALLLLGGKGKPKGSKHGLIEADSFGRDHCFFHALTMFEQSLKNEGVINRKCKQ